MGMEVLQNLQKFRVLRHRHTELTEVPVRVQSMMYPYPGYCGTGMKVLTEFPEVPCTGMKVLRNFQNFRVLWHGRTELPEIPGRYEHALPVPRVFMAPAYRNFEKFRVRV